MTGYISVADNKLSQNVSSYQTILVKSKCWQASIKVHGFLDFRLSVRVCVWGGGGCHSTKVLSTKLKSRGMRGDVIIYFIVRSFQYIVCLFCLFYGDCFCVCSFILYCAALVVTSIKAQLWTIEKDSVVSLARSPLADWCGSLQR